MGAGSKANVRSMETDAMQTRAAEAENIRLSYDSLHDLVSPANQLCTLTGLLIKQYGERLGPEADALVGLIQGSASRLQNLVAGFRLYAQIMGQTRPQEPCDANALLASALLPIQRAIHDSGAVISHDRLPEIHGDRTQLGIVFSNLVDNAIKFRSQEPPRIRIEATAQPGMWIFAVRDNGIGIDSRYHRRIFEMFKRVHNDGYPGAGVGLPIAEQIIARHGGTMWVESELGRGAAFFFSLPRPESLPQNSTDRRV